MQTADRLTGGRRFRLAMLLPSFIDPEIESQFQIFQT